jgi:HTH-type transcriptional regulator/antitoxin HipB
MAKNKRLGQPWEELRDEWYAEDPGMEARVDVLVEELRLQAKLYEARKAAGLTQKQVAERMNVNRSFVSKLENHPQDMKLSTFQRYAKAVGMRAEIALHA